MDYWFEYTATAEGEGLVGLWPYHFFARIYYLELHQGAKKVRFTACHVGKLLLVTY